MTGELFDGYEHEGFFDETFDPHGSVRAHYKALIKRLAELTPTELALRSTLRDEAFRTAGITFTVYVNEEEAAEGIERTFPMDLLPRLIPNDEWTEIEAGLIQRVTTLNLFLDDLYVGERAAINDGVIPKWLVASSSGFSREAFGLPVPKGARCLVAGIDLVRDAEGTYRVLEDNLRSPSGISYVLENRASMTRVLPNAFRDHGVRSVHHYGNSEHARREDDDRRVLTGSRRCDTVAMRSSRTYALCASSRSSTLGASVLKVDRPQPRWVATRSRSTTATPSTARAIAATTSDVQCTPSHTRLTLTTTTSVHTKTAIDHHNRRRVVYNAATRGSIPQLAAVASG
ncbi:MAG TPA: circularly permuted type 2 ATP-grasp protein [Acidimicrobiales bacterium]|nr:circularly permuted type 2 ATP-grasp protein [Acidimicrobiales bacterium]